MKTTITTELGGDAWIAKTPHMPGVEFEAHTESAAVNGLMSAIREEIKRAGDGGVEWIESPKIKTDKNKVARQLSGCWPPIIKKPQPDQSAQRKELNDASN